MTITEPKPDQSVDPSSAVSDEVIDAVMAGVDAGGDLASLDAASLGPRTSLRSRRRRRRGGRGPRARGDALLDSGWLVGARGGYEVSPAGVYGLSALGVDVEAARARRRAFARPCLDWTEPIELTNTSRSPSTRCRIGHRQLRHSSRRPEDADAV